MALTEVQTERIRTQVANAKLALESEAEELNKAARADIDVSARWEKWRERQAHVRKIELVYLSE